MLTSLRDATLIRPNKIFEQKGDLLNFKTNIDPRAVLTQVMPSQAEQSQAKPNQAKPSRAKPRWAKLSQAEPSWTNDHSWQTWAKHNLFKLWLQQMLHT